MVIIGNIISQCRNLRLCTCVRMQFKIMPRVIRSQCIRNVARYRAIVFGDAFQRLPRQVQAIPFSIVSFKAGHDPQRLRIVIETTVGLHQFIKRFFPGVTKGRVTQIMGQRDSFGQFHVQTKRTSNRTGNLCDLDRMC